jgi:hypothetical protein
MALPWVCLQDSALSYFDYWIKSSPVNLRLPMLSSRLLLTRALAWDDGFNDFDLIYRTTKNLPFRPLCVLTLADRLGFLITTTIISYIQLSIYAVNVATLF